MDVSEVLKHKSDSDEKGAFNISEIEGNLESLHLADLPSDPGAHFSAEERAAIVRLLRYP
jgi:hypothetical protein